MVRLFLAKTGAILFKVPLRLRLKAMVANDNVYGVSRQLFDAV